MVSPVCRGDNDTFAFVESDRPSVLCVGEPNVRHDSALIVSINDRPGLLDRPRFATVARFPDGWVPIDGSRRPASLLIREPQTAESRARSSKTRVQHGPSTAAIGGPQYCAHAVYEPADSVAGKGNSSERGVVLAGDLGASRAIGQTPGRR